MNTLLFVDDDPNILDALRRMLHGWRREYALEFCQDGRDALECMAARPVDALVSDIRMPDMNGVDLLTETARRHPGIIRFFLSGQCDTTEALRAVGPGHQFISKPCNPDELRYRISRALALRDSLPNPVIQHVVSRQTALPCLPGHTAQLRLELESPTASLPCVARVVEQDAGMSAKVVQLVNSAFFGLPQGITEPSEAVRFLGLDTVRTLTLGLHTFDEGLPEPPQHFSMLRMAGHSRRIAEAARQRLQEKGGPDARRHKEAYLAGLLHDCGILLLAAHCPREYDHAVRLARMKGITPAKAEQMVFGVSHAAVGAYLLGLWGLPDTVVDAVAFHHGPSQCPPSAMPVAEAVHAAHGGMAVPAMIHEDEENKYPGDSLWLPSNVPCYSNGGR